MTNMCTVDLLLPLLYSSHQNKDTSVLLGMCCCCYQDTVDTCQNCLRNMFQQNNLYGYKTGKLFNMFVEFEESKVVKSSTYDELQVSLTIPISMFMRTPIMLLCYLCVCIRICSVCVCVCVCV